MNVLLKNVKPNDVIRDIDGEVIVVREVASDKISYTKYGSSISGTIYGDLNGEVEKLPTAKLSHLQKGAIIISKDGSPCRVDNKFAFYRNFRPMVWWVALYSQNKAIWVGEQNSEVALLWKPGTGVSSAMMKKSTLSVGR